ncbi:MAG: thioredoxin domain-containing protein, partial [Chloroflexi bacterium]|nr:thioredoxin domain-containing protein [Chloroflexota bacterium]
MPNRLATETSPYLLQHSNNPVDWYPWGPEALERARREDKPILLSIGYSACHWCHVMEHESFENPATAAIMNEQFVNIKVDREERPDLDSIYMAAVQAMTGHGGWPMTVFLSPDGTPFYGGTYFPPEPRHGMPSFPQLLEAIANAYRTQRDQIEQNAAQMRSAIQPMVGSQQSGMDLGPRLLESTYRALARGFDWANGGFGSAPKFPQPMSLELMLRYHHRSGEAQALTIVERSLEKMARGGIYDQIGGGFARYSVDAVWLVPHFEKMLYDNAQLARIYLDTYLVSGKELYRRICEETLDFVIREMTAPSGGFYSTQDADSEGHEGKFYVWTPDEI